MKITFIFHSSYAVELKNSILIFDYYGEGELPDFPEGKTVYFLNSHAHKDHFRREILELKEKYPNAKYILSRDIRFGKETPPNWVYRVIPRESYVIDDLKVETLRSTDVGVAFIVETERVRIYHAGDLNWWHWEGEDKAWNNNMAANFKKELEKIEGRSFDAAFVPLDPRQENAYSWGMKYFLEHTHTGNVFPMHCWEKYEICEHIQKDPDFEGLLDHFYAVQYPGQEWNIC